MKGNMPSHDNDMPFRDSDSDDNIDEIGEMPATHMALPPQMSSSAYCDDLQLTFPETPAAVDLPALPGPDRTHLGHPWFPNNADIDTGYIPTNLTHPASYHDISAANLIVEPTHFPYSPSQPPFTQTVGRLLGANTIDNDVDNDVINYSSSSFVGNDLHGHFIVHMQTANYGSPENVKVTQATTSASTSLATSIPYDEHGSAPDAAKPTCFCGKTFSRNDSLNHHVRTLNHHRDTTQGVLAQGGSGTTQSGGPFHCTYCDRHLNGFVRPDHLRQHLGSYHKLKKAAIDAYLFVTNSN